MVDGMACETKPIEPAEATCIVHAAIPVETQYFASPNERPDGGTANETYRAKQSQSRDPIAGDMAPLRGKDQMR